LAVDFHHFLVVSGSRAAIGDFVRRIALVVDRRVAGRSERQTVPFSFQSLWAMTRAKGEIPYDAYDMKRWPVLRRGRDAEVRYSFHTRNLELPPLLKKLSRVTPKLTFGLATICLDDSDFGAYTIRNGRVRGDWLGGDWREPFWERAARKFEIPLDESYDDPAVESTAEGWMRDAAIQIATSSKRIYRWNGGIVYRDFEDERASAMYELAVAMNQLEAQDKATRRRTPR
jgi:hypothetical protein